MKTYIAMIAGAALTVSPFVDQSFAGDREWSTAGKVLTGVFAAQVISRALQPPPVYVAPTPVYVQQPVYVQTTPTVVQTVPVVQTTTVPVATVVTTPAIPNAPTVAAAPVAPAAPAVVSAPVTTTVVQPVYVTAPPTYIAPSPVYVAPVPMYAPAPIVSVGFGFGRYWGPHHYYRGRGCW